MRILGVEMGRAKWLVVLCLAMCALLGSGQAWARTPFEQGKMRLSAMATTTSAFDARYVVIGVGFGVFVLDGLEVGADLDFWLGAGGPFIFVATPQLRYVWAASDYFAPYIGTFYRHWFITQGIKDIDSVGGRAGLFILPQGPAVLGLGLAYERIVSACEEECDRFYPELQIALLF